MQIKTMWKRFPLLATISGLFIIFSFTNPYLSSTNIPIANGSSYSQKSGLYNSHYPTAFLSNTGRTHLLFLHEGTYIDVGVRTYYHSYELDGNWSVPYKIFKNYYTDPVIFNISTNENGFCIYYKTYEKGQIAGVYKREFNERTNKWSEQSAILTSSIVAEYFQLEKSSISELNVHSFLILVDGSFFVFWSFHISLHGDESHPFEGWLLFSRHDKDGNLQSVDESLSVGTIVKFQHDSYFIYSSDFVDRTILFSNGTQTFYPVDNSSTGFTAISTSYWSNPPFHIIENRFLVYSVEAVDLNSPGEWGMLDLAAENLTLKVLDPPKKPENHSSLNKYGIDFILNPNTSDEIIFDLAIKTDNTIEIWNFQYSTNNWSQISTLEYRNSGSWELDPFTIDIIRDGSDLRVFWDQEVKYLLHEIYSVNYNVETGKWGPVIQITDTNTINDDYEEAPGFTLTTTLIFLLITFFFRKKTLRTR